MTFKRRLKWISSGVAIVVMGRAAAAVEIIAPSAPPCGTVAVYSALVAVGVEPSAREVAARLGPGPDHRLDELVAAVQSFGAHAELVRLEKNDLITPSFVRGSGAWILAVTRNGEAIDHCIAATHATDQGVRVAQFPDGLLDLSWGELQEQWSGEAILVLRQEPPVPGMSRLLFGGFGLVGLGGGVWWVSSPRRRLVRQLARRLAARRLGPTILPLVVLAVTPTTRAESLDHANEPDALRAIELEIQSAPERLGRSLKLNELVALIAATNLTETLDPTEARVAEARTLHAWHATRTPLLELNDIAATFAARRDELTQFDTQWTVERVVEKEVAGSIYQVPAGYEQLVFRCRFAMNGPLRYLSLSQQHDPDLPEVSEHRITDGVRDFVYHPARGIGMIQWAVDPAEYLPNREPWPAVGGLIGSRSEGTAVVRERDLAELLDQIGLGAWVAEEMFLVRGRPAIAVGVGLEDPLMIYLDPARGLAPLRVDDTAVLQGQRIRTRTEMMSLKQIGQFWIPHRIERSQSLVGTDGSDLPYLTEIWTLQSITLNEEIDASLFNPNILFPRGTFIVDEVAGRTWRHELQPAEFLRELGATIEGERLKEASQ